MVDSSAKEFSKGSITRFPPLPPRSIYSNKTVKLKIHGNRVSAILSRGLTNSPPTKIVLKIVPDGTFEIKNVNFWEDMHPAPPP